AALVLLLDPACAEAAALLLDELRGVAGALLPRHAETGVLRLGVMPLRVEEALLAPGRREHDELALAHADHRGDRADEVLRNARRLVDHEQADALVGADVGLFARQAHDPRPVGQFEFGLRLADEGHGPAEGTKPLLAIPQQLLCLALRPADEQAKAV